MATRRDSIERHLPLTAASFHVLLALADEPRHGYAIMQEVEERTGGRVRLGPGTLYGVIKRLRESELIAEDLGGAGDADDRRRVYRLTRLGRDVVEAEAGRLSALVDAARAKSVLPARGRA